MMHPQVLQKGDHVTIVATARKISLEEIMPAVEMLQQWGLNVVVPDGLFAVENQFAGNDTHRASVLQKAIDNPQIKAIFCARGGYGTVRIVDMVNFGAMKAHPKWIVGYSDVTVLHCHLHSLMGMPTLHATMPIDITQNVLEGSYPATESLRKVLFGEVLEYTFPAHRLNKNGPAHGVVVGGNLSILYSICGSASDIDTDDKILFIEDLDEYLYHIDRMMFQMKRCGKLQRLKALVVGAMSDMHDNNVAFGKDAEEIILDAVRQYDYPVYFGAPFGHISSNNRALPLGTEVSIQSCDSEGAVCMKF